MTHPLLAPTNAEQPRSYQRSIANGRLSFRPPAVVVDSTRRKSLIRWQKRAAVWEHGFESRWGHHCFSRCGRWSAAITPSPARAALQPEPVVAQFFDATPRALLLRQLAEAPQLACGSAIAPARQAPACLGVR